ncbi:MAG TPA: hypothetical protein VFZ09_27500 [Archangium sp.]|uniref:hypothetical protein n=1 Tax=Archangium sp. TaxID=1872627 RepID=UPI002E2F75C5|nr:hypothetical protein [Archangium sp.]HEX5750006.1 hypothetical protein [Archangium sp.]
MADTQRGNQLGQYQLGPRYRDTQDMGRIYRAHNVETGAPALVLQRTERQVDEQPLANWQVRVTSSVSPAFLALEVECAPAAGLPADVAEEFVVMMGDAEQLANAVVDRPETLPHLRAAPRHPAARTTPDQQITKFRNFETRPAPSWRRPFLAAGLVAAAAAVLLHLGGAEPPPHYEPGAELAQGDVDAGWGWDDASVATGMVLTNSADDLPIVLARALPKKPFSNQKRPPCEKLLEVEINNGCWVPHEVRAPCPDRLYEFGGKCYLPAAKPESSPRALSRQSLAFDRP